MNRNLRKEEDAQFLEEEAADAQLALAPLFVAHKADDEEQADVTEEEEEEEDSKEEDDVLDSDDHRETENSRNDIDLDSKLPARKRRKNEQQAEEDEEVEENELEPPESSDQNGV